MVFKQIYGGLSKSSRAHTEKRTTAEHFGCGNVLPVLIKVEKSGLASLVVVCCHNKNVKLRLIFQDEA